MTDTKKQSIDTIQNITGYHSKYNLYSMTVEYDYDVDDVIKSFTSCRADYKTGKIKADQAADEAVRISLGIETTKTVGLPAFGCTAFTAKISENDVRMGRNYDFKINTSGMMVRCKPKSVGNDRRYKSIAFAALANIGITDPILQKDKILLAAPYICLDGINEKGVSIAVLVVDGELTCQFDNDKQNLFTTLAIRLVLDKADSTDTAVKLLKDYNMFAVGGKDYHFYISDASGNGVVVEYDYKHLDTRALKVTPTRVVTNFYIYDKEHYGHGYDRYITVQKILDRLPEKTGSNELLWTALEDSSQEPIEGDPTSNTQWSILFDNTDKRAEIVFRRHWDDKYTFRVEN